jgi:murein DD-endopeptidase MepM/ murein hydrolase activator NlpD/transglutaminase-like putative cysteine protease
MRTFYRTLKILSVITLFFFCWTFLPLWQAVAYASEKQKSEVRSQKSEGLQKTEPRTQTAGERFEKALEDIREHIGKAEEKSRKGKEPVDEINAIKSRKAEIESIDAELKTEFAATEKKLKDAHLSSEILERHHKFVKHYQDNLKELVANLTGIERAQTKVEVEAKVKKAKDHLEKTKPPRRHKALDPNKLPNRMVKAKERTPRTRPEEFRKEFGPGSRGKGHVARGQWIQDAGYTIQDIKDYASVSKPILLAYNGDLNDLQLPPASTHQRFYASTFDPSSHQRFDASTQHAFTLQHFDASTPLLLAQAAPVDAPTADDLAETPDIRFSPELRKIATLLENNPVQLYEFVRNNFTYDPYYGSVKGSQGTLLLQNGNDFDQASVLIGLFRVSGIPARYAYGTVEIPIEKVMKWLGGITDPRTAGTVLATNGIPAKLIISGGAIKSVQLEHTWIEVYIPYSNYRGLANDPTASKTWIPLDPSFKLIEPNQNAVDLADAQQFNIDTYSTSYLQTLKPTTPAKDYLSTTMNYVTNNLSGQSFYDLLASGSIINKVLGLLPDTLSYPVKTIGGKFSTIPDSYRQKIAFEFSDPSTNEMVMSYTASWASLLHNRFTISYIPATTTDEQTIANYGDIYSTPPYLIKVKPVLKVDGTTVAEGNPIGMGGDLIFKMSFIGSQGTIDNVITNHLTVGATHAICFGSGYTTGRVIKYRGEKLRTAAAAGQSGEPILGEYLNLLALDYLQELDSSRKLISKSMKLLDTDRMAELMVGVDLGVSYIFGVPRAVDINGVLIDVDFNISTPVDIDGNQAKVRRFQILTGMTSSALEHTVFESIVGVESVSTIKALEIANVQGIPVHQIDIGNIATKLPLLHLSGEVITDIQNAVNAGKVVTVSERNIQLNEWNGAGYIILDPITGAGAYMISGGIAGGSLTQKIQQGRELLAHGDFKTEQEVTNAILKLYGKIYFPMPIDGDITSHFSMRPAGPHYGVDIAADNWTPVTAVADGTVKNAIYGNLTSGPGFYIDIDHGLGVITRYLHNCQLNVKAGDKVKEGDVISLSGNTGHITSSWYNINDPNFTRCSNTNAGSHVHFEILIGGNAVDPEVYGQW